MTDNPTGPDLDALAAMVEPALSWVKYGEAYDQRCTYAKTLIEQVPALLDRLAQYEGAITWGTSCLSCSKVLDGAYQETVRAEQAEKERDLLGRQQQAILDLAHAADAAEDNFLTTQEIYGALITDPADAPAAAPLPAAASDRAPHCGLCGSEDCPGTPGQGCMPGPFETYEPVPVDTGTSMAGAGEDSGQEATA